MSAEDPHAYWQNHPPEPEVWIRPCRECRNFWPCPCGKCDCGWCEAIGDYVDADAADECDLGFE